MSTVNKMDSCIPSNHSHSKLKCSLHPHSGVDIKLSCSWLDSAGHSHLKQVSDMSLSTWYQYMAEWGGGGWWDEAHRERETERGNNREVCGRNNGVTYWWNSSLRTLETCLTPVWQQIVLQNISLSASRFPLSLCQVSTVYLYVAEPACEHSVVIHTFKTHL